MSDVSEQSLLDYFHSTAGGSGRVRNADLLKTFKPFIGHADLQLRGELLGGNFAWQTLDDGGWLRGDVASSRAVSLTTIMASCSPDSSHIWMVTSPDFESSVPQSVLTSRSDGPALFSAVRPHLVRVKRPSIQPEFQQEWCHFLSLAGRRW